MLPKTIGTFQEQFLQTLRNGSQLCCRRRKGQVTNFNRRKTRVLIFTFRTGHLTWYYMPIARRLQTSQEDIVKLITESCKRFY